MTSHHAIQIDDTHYTLPEIEDLAWSLLEQGAESGRKAFHVGGFCTVESDGFPNGRSMVLRHVDTAHRLLASYTDLRSPKVAHIQQDKRSCWNFYDSARGIQVITWGPTQIHAGADDPVATHLWAKLSPAARHAFAARVPAGTPIDGPVVENDDESPPGPFTRAVSEAFFGNFGVLMSRVEELEFLHLHHTGHRRARFCYGGPGSGCTERTWLAA